MTALDLARKLAYAARAHEMADAPVALIRMLQSEGCWFMDMHAKQPMPSVMQEPELAYTVNEAAALSRVTRRTINSWIARGKVNVVYTASGKRRVLASSLRKGDAM